MKRLTIILTLFICACNPFGVTPEAGYVIEAGQHNSTSKIRAKIGERVDFTFTFDPTHFYYDELPTLDINKLYGLTGLNIHKNSARFGWRDNDGIIEVFAYWYKNGVRGFELLGTADMFEKNYYHVAMTGKQYRWVFKDREFIVPDTKNVLTVARSWPYFGGNEPAPHRMSFIIHEL
jgi:hypothetical protein